MIEGSVSRKAALAASVDQLAILTRRLADIASALAACSDTTDTPSPTPLLQQARQTLLEAQQTLEHAKTYTDDYQEFLRRHTLHSSELDAILESTDTQMALLDADFNFVHVNSAYITSCGYAREELIGRNHFALFPNEENATIFSCVRETGIPYRAVEKPFEYPNRPELGTTYWNWIFTPIGLSNDQQERFLLSPAFQSGGVYQVADHMVHAPHSAHNHRQPLLRLLVQVVRK